MDYLVRFLDEDSAGDENVWLSDVYEDIASAKPNREYAVCLYRAAFVNGLNAARLPIRA